MRLRYWTKSSLEATAGLLGGTLVYAIMMGLQSEDSTFQDILLTFAIYAVAYGGVFEAIMNFSVYNNDNALPISLSFGSTRKEALLGYQLYRLIPAVICSAIAALIVLFLDTEVYIPALMVFCCGMAIVLIPGAWGSVTGILRAKYGNKAGITSFIVGFMLLVAVLVAIIMWALSASEEQIVGVIFSPVFYVGALLVGIALHCLCLLAEKKAFDKYSVKL